MRHFPSRRAIAVGLIVGPVAASSRGLAQDAARPAAPQDAGSEITAKNSLATQLLDLHAKIEADYEADTIAEDEYLSAIIEAERRLAEAKPESINDLAALLEWSAHLTRQNSMPDEAGKAVLENCAAFAMELAGREVAS